MSTNRLLRVFLCHSSNDKPAVRELYQQLRAVPWIQPWLDEEEIFPGQDWNLEIEKAVEASDAILVCLTKGSVTKEGYIQRELRKVLEFADYKPEGTLFIIPVRLEECEPHRSLRKWQYADYFAGSRERAFQRLLVSLRRRAEALDLDTSASTTKQDPLNLNINQPAIPVKRDQDDTFTWLEALVGKLGAVVSPETSKGAEKTDFNLLGLASPISHTISTYVLGDDLYDESFSIDTPDGEFLGEYGVGVSERIGVGEPKKVTALEVWLFDKNDIKTSTKVLLTEYAWNVPTIRAISEPKGELILVQPNAETLLETATLQLLVRIMDLKYGDDPLLRNNYFERITLELAVWPRK